MAALAGRHVHDAVGLPPRGDRHALRRALGTRMHARRIHIARERRRRHVEPAVDEGHGARQRMPVRGHVVLGPDPVAKIAAAEIATAIPHRPCDRRIQGVAQHLRPCRVPRIEQVLRLFCHEHPGRRIAEPHGRVVECPVCLVAFREHEGDDALRHDPPKLARQAVRC